MIYCEELGTLAPGIGPDVILQCAHCGWSIGLGSEANLNDVLVAETDHINYAARVRSLWLVPAQRQAAGDE